MLKSAKLPLKFLCENIEKSLMEVNCTQAAYFGSVATKTTEQYSDVDLIICGDNIMAQQFIHRFRQYKPIALYLPFGNRQPAGRYWFKGLPLYLKLDFSFHGTDEYQRLLKEGNKVITGPFKCFSLSALNKT